MKKKEQSRKDVIQYINMKLVALGFEPVIRKNSDIESISDKKFLNIANNLIQNYRAKSRLLTNYYCPADTRINNFIHNYLQDIDFVEELKVPQKSFILDEKGIARELSLPPDKNKYITKHLSSYRIQQGVLHNPVHDRRTTKGSFHIVADGLPVPMDKIEVPRIAFANLLKEALNPPKELMKIPFTKSGKEQAHCFVSLLLRPIVCPQVPNVLEEKSLEVRFFAPGSFVSNLDFVESIFGNAGNPNHPENDAGLDFAHWTGHTGCIILAPHLINLKKVDLGLPHYDDATERQRRDGMCWKSEDELYNNGTAFKLTCRDERGVVITLIADNYFGYSKKEIKTQISYSANLYGLSEEEHAGGAIAFPRKNLGPQFQGDLFAKKLDTDYSFEEIKKTYSNIMELKPENYGIDKKRSNIIYIPENADIDMYKGEVKWEYQGKNHNLKLSPDNYYVLPSGYKIKMEKHPSERSWRLISTSPEGTFCHKPCTVSGGGKSEISKSLLNAIIYDPFYIQDMEKDFALAEELIEYNFSKRWKDPVKRNNPSRPLLAMERTLGSVIKLLSPSEFYNDAYNAYLQGIPEHVKSLVFFVKRFYRPNRHTGSWKEFLSVDVVNGRKGNKLLFDNRAITASYLRVGFAADNSWFLHKLRADFIAATKIQMEDDITASVVVPSEKLPYLQSYKKPSVKLTTNCERKFFQRPDEAIHRGYDKEAESDLSMRGNFTSNYEPLSSKDAKELIDNAIHFDEYTLPIQKLIKKGAKNKKSFFISPSHTRVLEDGSRSQNPRYLQTRPDLVDATDEYLANIGIRFARKIPSDSPVYHPVDAVLSGRRNNPADRKAGIRALSVYNPIHYQELPELFMDFICSLTGKSPSTTGAGSEGALTKGPFNMLSPTTDLNNALLSFILTGYQGFSSAAGYVGTENRFDHDISLLIPEVWSRMTEKERSPEELIEDGALEKLEDFEHNGETILASRLGYRITSRFLFKFMNRVFNEPQAVFTERMLKPELQGIEDYVDGIKNITEAQERVALNYFLDDSSEAAIPPIKALLHVMAYGHYEGKKMSDPELRKLFTREYVLQSDWYKERLERKQSIDIERCIQSITYIKSFIASPGNTDVSESLKLSKKLEKAEQNLSYFKSDQYLKDLVGTIGADPLHKPKEA